VKLITLNDLHARLTPRAEEKVRLEEGDILIWLDWIQLRDDTTQML